MYMKKILFGLIFICIFACSRKKDVLGPAICPPNDFSPKEALVLGYDMAFTALKDSSYVYKREVDSLDFNAVKSFNVKTNFSLPVYWLLEIKGNESGAYYLESKVSAKVDVKWFGNANKFFKNGEICTVTLSFPCDGKNFEPLKASIIMKNYSGFIGNATLFTDFNNSGVNTADSWMPRAVQSGADFLDETKITDLSPSPQGGKYISFKKKTISGAKAWYFAGKDIPVIINPKLNDPSDVYCNVLMRKTEPNSGLSLIFNERQGDNDVANGPYTISVDSPEWKWYSFKLSDKLPNLVDPSKISGISYGIESYPEQTNKAGFDLDFMIFTKGGPFIKE